MKWFLLAAGILLLGGVIYAIYRSSTDRDDLVAQNKALSEQLDKYHADAAQRIEEQQLRIVRMEAQLEKAQIRTTLAAAQIKELAKRLEIAEAKNAENDIIIDALSLPELPGRIHDAAERYRRDHPK